MFTTTHFSEYYVVSDSVAENATTGKKYATLQEAIDSANDGNEIKMLSNVVLKNNVVFSQDYYVTLNMDGKEILLDVNPNAETACLLLVKGKARLVITGAGSFDYTSEYENEGSKYPHSPAIAFRCIYLKLFKYIIHILKCF